MAVVTQSDELITQKRMRAFFQPGGAGPDNKPLFAGQDMQYMRIEGVDAPVLGDVKPMFIHDPNSVGSYKPVASMISPPDFAKADLVLSEKRGYVPRQFLAPKCNYNAYEVIGQCKDLSDFNNGWSDYVAIYPGGILTGRNFGDRTTWEDDKANETKLSTTFTRPFYAAGPIGFGPVGAAALFTLKVVNDVCYYGGATCADCGVDNDGAQWVAAVNTGGAATKPDLLYSTDGGKTWTAVNITAAANAEVLNGVFWNGSKLVAMSKTAGTTIGGFYIFDVNTFTGVPTYNSKVTTGFVASSAANDVLVISPNEIYFCADAGYVYKSTDVFAGVTVLSAGAATTNNLQRIDGSSEIIVCSGATATLIYSTNRGVSFGPTTTTPVGAVTYGALNVNSRNLWWVGTAGGQVFYTKNAGETWTEKVIETNSAINDIVFITAECGFILASTATPSARIYATLNGGWSWTRSLPRVGNIPTFTKASRLAVPVTTDSEVKVNQFLIGGTTNAGADGYLLLGAANYQ